jgi:membrane protein YqaA with SNARE-associated domain
MDTWISTLLSILALPQYGLVSVFIACFISATLLPVGSEAFVFGLIALNPDLFWPTMCVATAGNTLGGGLSWWMGYNAEKFYKAHDVKARGQHEARGLIWLKRFGPRACLLSWLPFVGDPLCAVAGWLKLPFWPCLGYMLVGKFCRYLVFTSTLLWIWPIVRTW